MKFSELTPRLQVSSELFRHPERCVPVDSCTHLHVIMFCYLKIVTIFSFLHATYHQLLHTQ